MKSNKGTVALTFLILLSISCSFLTGLVPKPGANNPVAQPPVASGNGPSGLTAQATSADSVLLSWNAVDGAIAYNVQVSINGNKALSLISLPASATSYLDFLAMPSSQLTYAVEAVGQAGSIGQSVVDVSTTARQPNPLTVEAQFDENTSATQTIGTEGGSVSLTDAKGVVYKLDIPAGALTDQTEVKLTVVSGIGGWPLDGEMLGGVKIEPEGLQLNDVATLSITLPNGLPSDKLSTFGYAFSGSGQEFHLQPASRQNRTTGLVPVPSDNVYLASFAQQANPAEIIQTVLEFYGIGVGQGSAESAGNLAKNNPPTDAGAAMDQKQAIISAEGDELFPLPNLPKPTANQYDADASITASAVSLLISTAGDCGALHSAMVSFQKWRSRADFDKGGALHPDQITATEKQIMDNLADKIKETMDKVAEGCKKPSGQEKTAAAAQVGCLQSILDKIANPPSTRSGFWGDLQSKMNNKYGSNVATDYQKKLSKCNAVAIEASGNSGGISFSGGTCDSTQPFHINGVGNGGSWTAVLSPSGDTGGDIVYSGGGSGCTEGGSGSYTLEMNENGSGFIIMTTHGTVSCPGLGSKKGDREFTILITPSTTCQ